MSVKTKSNDAFNKIGKFIKRGYRWVLLAYILLCVLYYIFFILFQVGTYACLDNEFGVGFSISFSASLLDDLIVFFVLGILGAIIPILVSKSPEEEDFNTRVTALMNSQNVVGNDRLVNYLKQYLTTFLAYICKMKITVIIKDYNEKNNAFKIFCEYDIVLSNMCRDSEYEVKDPKIEVFPDIDVDGDFGHVSYLGTYNPNTLQPINTIIDDDKKEDNVPIIGHFEKDLSYKIPKDGQIAWKLRFTIWSKIYDDQYDDPEKWFTQSILRYSQNLQIVLENHLHSQHNVTFDVNKFNAQTKKRDLIANKEVLGYNSDGPKIISSEQEFHPGDRIEFYFYKP